MNTQERITYVVVPCKFGSVLVAKSSVGICAILLGAETTVPSPALARRFPHAVLIYDETLKSAASKVATFVDDPRRPLDIALDVRGTPFQKKVWQALMQVPAGATATYTDIANAIGAPKSVRAVGAACGANMHAIVIPCHRIVRSDGGLAGFRWGGQGNKSMLLRAEAAEMGPQRSLPV